MKIISSIKLLATGLLTAVAFSAYAQSSVAQMMAAKIGQDDGMAMAYLISGDLPSFDEGSVAESSVIIFVGPNCKKCAEIYLASRDTLKRGKFIRWIPVGEGQDAQNFASALLKNGPNVLAAGLPKSVDPLTDLQAAKMKSANDFYSGMMKGVNKKATLPTYIYLQSGTIIRVATSEKEDEGAVQTIFGISGK